MTRIIKQSIIWIIGSLFIFPLCSFSVNTDSLAEAKTIIIDVGHTKQSPGVISTIGESEFIYNKIFGITLMWKLKRDGHDVTIIENQSLKERVRNINSSDADLVISIHHDSTQPQYLGKNKYRGFSIFIHDKKNLPFAMDLGKRLVECGYSPSLHHAENILGERKPLLSKEYGVYRSNFYILKHSKKPIVLFEVGVITNSEEEKTLRDSSSIDKMAQCIVEVLK